MRPIIPCHSAVQIPATKYVDKCLRPLVEEAPTIIHGSKDLAIKLSKLSINYNRKYYIITGDVVAFYPSIPIEECMTIILHLYEEFIGTVDINPATISTLEQRRKFSEILLFAECLHLGNTKLICTYMGKYYLQLKGLAMGVASSPSIANLYGWFFERQCNILNDPNIIFYGHYIDDCLAIVYADNEDQALMTLQKLKIGPCIIEWTVPGESPPILDMLLFKDENKCLHIARHSLITKESHGFLIIPWM